jgi:PAS domain S-box-containing protein
MGESEHKEDYFLNNSLIDALFDENRDILILTSEKLEIVRINQSASVYFGLSVESLIGRNIGALFDSPNQARLKAITSLLNLDGETINTHFDIVDYLGNEQKILTGIRFIQCANCQRKFYLFFFRRTHQAGGGHFGQLDSEQLVQRVLKGLSDSVLLIDMATRTIGDCNMAAEALFGYPREEMLGRSPQFLAPDEETAKGYVSRGREGYAKTGFFQAKILCRRKDGSLFMTLATNIALFDGKGAQKYTLAINKDLTQDEKRIDDIVRLSEQSQRLLQTLNESILPLKSNVPSESLGGLGFSRRQIDIASILVAGETTKVIAARLKVSESAIKSHLSLMYRRAGVSSRMEFIKYLHDRQIRIE